MSFSGHVAAGFAAPNLLESGEWVDMRQQHAIVAAFMLAVMATPGDAAAADSTSYTDRIAATITFVNTIIASGYRAAPALMLGLAMLFAIPLMAMASRMWLWSKAPHGATRRYRSSARGSDEDVSETIDGDAPALPGHAYLEVVGSRGARFTIWRDMLRIGREDDNDIRIPSDAVHRYHAAIHREDPGVYRITDLSGVEGNGVVVNGQRCKDAKLYDGDMIELGPGRLRFHAGLL